MTPSKPLPELAAEIKTAHQQAESHSTSFLEHARHAGDLLLEAKSRLTHGEWLPWVETNCQFSIRTAQDYMKVAKEWPNRANTQDASHLALRNALRSQQDPASVEWHSPPEIIEAATKR